MNGFKWVFIFFFDNLLRGGISKQLDVSSKLVSSLCLCFAFLILPTESSGQAPLSIKAQDTLFYQSDSAITEIGPYCQTYVDEKAPIDVEQFKNLPDSLLQKTKSGTLTFGNATNAWVRLLVKNQTNEPLYLNFWGFGLTHIDIFTQNENGTFSVRQTGTEQNYANRDLKRGNIVINIGQSPQVVYIHLQSNLPLNSLVSLSALKPLANTYYERDTFNAICLGILIAMALYNLFLFFSVRESLYLYYFVYIMMALWSVAEMNSTWRHFIGWGLGLGTRQLLIISGILFTMRFLNTRAKLSLGHKVLVTIIGLFCVGIVLDTLDWQPFSNQLFQVTALTCLLVLPSLGILAYRQGNKSALPYSIAWTILIVSAILGVLTTHGILPVNFWTRNIFPIGTCIETILLAFALAYRIKEYRDASEAAQKLAIQRLEENEKLVNEQNQVLEVRVAERTEDLQTTLSQLQSTESQLVQSEKMAALGELTAGIAHEINNPVNFISSSLVPLKRNLSTMDSLIQQYESLTAANFEEKIKEIKAFREEIDYNYTKEEIGLLTNSINDGATRTAEIVRGLRNFSRTDESEQKKASVNEGLESTLLLMQSAFKKKNIQLVQDLGNLPNIHCFAGQLNQVFMNILTNAIQAMPDKGTITVNSFVDNSSNTIKVTIADTGKGMTEEVKTKIFQPFFTTKDVGEGTGLGLSISYGIIKKHDGQIDVESELGKGTVFVITLPITITNNQ